MRRFAFLHSLFPAGLLLATAVAGQPQETSPQAVDEPGATWAPAAPGNYRTANRPAEGKIDVVVIHDIEGTAPSAVSWFANPQARVSAHYVVDGTGRVWQTVRERDVGYHAGNTDVNGRSIGIEHEGFAYRPGFFDPSLYEVSTRLVRSITTRYGIPRDRTHVIGHAEVPHPTEPGRFGGRNAHTDPGPYWDWDTYMALLRNDARLETVSAPSVIHPGELLPATVTLANTGDDPWPVQAGRRRDAAAEARGPVYLAARPQPPLSAIPSPFYDPKSWTSPRFAVPPQATGEVPPGQSATFALTLRGPRALGPATEPFRLAKVPVAPRSPVPFGPALTLSLRVEPWDLLPGLEAPAFEAPGWHEKTRGGRFFWRKLDPRAPAVSPARWQVPLPIDGEWEVFARWPRGPLRTRQAVYEIAAAGGTRRVATDQRRGGGAWRRLGRFRFAGAKPVAAVSLTASPGARGVLVTGPIRLAGPYPSAVPPAGSR